MAKAAPAPAPVAAPRKGPNPAVSALRKGIEKANDGRKAALAKAADLRKNGRFGRAMVDGAEAALGGLVGGLVDGAGINIPIGEERHYAWIEVSVDEKGNVTGFKDADGNGQMGLADAVRGHEIEAMSIPVAVPAGLLAVGIGASMEQADAVEFGKGMLGYGFGRLGADLARSVKDSLSQ